MTHSRMLRCLLTVTALAVPLLLLADEKLDLGIVHRIKSEAFQNSKVMDHMFYLTDVHGPRLTGSPGYKGAADWVVSRLKEYGLANVAEEKWGPFGRGWRNKRFEAHLLEPQYAPIIGFPTAWTESTAGAVIGEPMMTPMTKEADFEKYKGKLKGKIIMIQAMKELAMEMKAPGHRYTDAELAEEAQAETPGNPGRFGGPRVGPDGQPLTPEERRKMAEERRKFGEALSKFLKEEGVALVLSTGYLGDGGTIFASSGGSYDTKKLVGPPSAAITPEHYNRIARLLAHKIPVKVEFNIQNELFEDAKESMNVVAEIPGHSKKDEIVMLGAHLDSWHGGTGATDNGAGSAVMMEAIRILKALNLNMDRTVRLGLWGGEEEGLLGSKAYVKDHFGDPETMKLGPEHAKLAGYFNYDNGTGKIRGVYLQGNDLMRPIFEEWLKPWHDMGATTVSVRNTGGTDHQSYDAVGLPGFQFIQDPMEYSTRTHHSNMDVYDRIQAADLMQASAIIADFVFNTANRAEMLPRKPLPKPRPARREGQTDAASVGQ